MKKVLLGTLVLLLAVSLMETQAQITTPAPSPSSTLKQTVGLVDIKVEYSRPGIKGRTIFGDLVPYDKVWRLGANAATKMTVSDAVKIGGKKLDKGSYAVLAKPGKSSWSFMFYPYSSGNFGSYLEGDVEPVKVTSTPISLGEMSIENFQITIDEISNNGATMYVVWDNTAVPLEIKVNTAEAVEANIERVMAGPSAGDYYAAASYYLAEGKNLDKARKWITKSVDMGNERFWVLRTKSLIEAKLGDKTAALESAKRSLELAKEAGNNDYIKMNEASIKEWMM